MPHLNYSAKERTPNLLPKTLSAEKGLKLLPISSNVVLDIFRTTESNHKYKSVYIGIQPSHALLFKMPTLTSDNCSNLLKIGNLTTIRAIYTQGEGGIIAFQSTIIRIYPSPFSMISITIPETVQLQLFRNEPRFKMDLPAHLTWDNFTLSGAVEDISCNGCCFCTANIQDDLLDKSIIILLSNTESTINYKLTGTVKNTRIIKYYQYIGISFCDETKVLVQQLLQTFILKGCREF